MFLLPWDKDAKKVISRLYVTGASLSVVTGIMSGRVFGTGNKVVEILKEQKII